LFCLKFIFRQKYLIYLEAIYVGCHSPSFQVDLDWNMEHLNQEELKLLNSVIAEDAEDGMEASKSVVHDPKKERAIAAFWLEKCKGCWKWARV